MYVEVVKNNGEEMYKKMCSTCKVGFFSLLSPIDYVCISRCRHRLALHRFNFFFFFLGYNFEYINDSCASSPG